MYNFIGAPASIYPAPQGENGHGFDPVFMPQGYSKTFAQMSADEKNMISHRAKAINLFKQAYSENDESPSTTFLDSGFKLVGGIILIICSIALFLLSRNILFGEFKVIRYRSIMYMIGVFAGLSVLIPQGFETNNFGILPITIGLLISLNDWFGSDEQKVIRKEFKQKLDKIESELLVHRSKGRSVDQAASLVLTASQEGHLDPTYGLEILSRARDSMTRSIRLEEDISEIRKDTESIVLTAEKIAPIAKKSRKTFIQAEREVELGSLEEGESLFRLAKKQAKEITDWWDKAEKAISKAKKLLREHKGEAIQSLEKLLSEAENKF